MAMATVVAAATPPPAAMMSSLPPAPPHLPPSSAPGGPSSNSSPRSDNDDDGDYGGGRLGGASSLSLALRGSDPSGSDFVVGSLPMHLRRGPAAPSLSTMRALPSNGRADGGGPSSFAGPASLPTHMRAPFLSSREGPAHKLSR